MRRQAEPTQLINKLFTSVKFQSCLPPTSQCSSAGCPKCHIRQCSCTCCVSSCSRGFVRIPLEKEAEHKGPMGLSAKYYRPGLGNDNNTSIKLLFPCETTYGDSLSWPCPAPAASNRCRPVQNS